VNEGVCYVIGCQPWIANGQSHAATIGNWMAWRDYRISKKISVKFMDYQAQRGKTWTVPTLWPNEFDADRTVQDDHMAAGKYRENPFREKQREDLSDEDRRRISNKILKSIRYAE
jgi:hypothetical protein